MRLCATTRKVASSIPDGATRISFRPHYGPGVDSASNRNEYQEYFLGVKGGRYVGQTAVPPSCPDCHEIREPQPSAIPRTCPEIALHLRFCYARFVVNISLISTNYLLHTASYSKYTRHDIKKKTVKGEDDIRKICYSAHARICLI